MQAAADHELEQALEQEAAAEMWRRGDLTYKLHRGQLELFHDIFPRWVAERELVARVSRYVLEIARKYGKTWLLVVIAIMFCLRRSRARVVYGAPTLKHLEEFVLPALEDITADAPPELKSKYNSQTGHWEFPNGSYIHLFGADDKQKADRGRGPAADASIFDEAGFCRILRYVIRSIFRPQMLHTRGPTILGSTPAAEPDHDFTKLAELAEGLGAYARRTIHENPLLTPEQIQSFIAEDAKDEGMAEEEYTRSDDFLREYMAQRVVDRTLVVLSEWADVRAECMRAVERPEYFDAYTFLDMGGADPHAVLFGYWHFQLAKLVFEEELLLRDGENTQQLADRIKAKELELWGTDQHDGTIRLAQEVENLPKYLQELLHEKAPRQPLARWADNDLQMIRDLSVLNGITFFPTAKDDLKWQVNALRIALRSKEIILHPRCVHTDRHWRTTLWKNERRKDFRRVNGEHGDLVACAVYGYRNLDKQRNPYPRPPATDLRARREEVGRPGALARALIGDSPLGKKLLGG